MAFLLVTCELAKYCCNYLLLCDNNDRHSPSLVPNDTTRNLLVHLCSMMHTSFVSITDRATFSLSGVSCVLIRPSFRAPVSICNSLNWNLVRPEGLCVIPWLWPKLITGLWLTPGWCVGNLKRQDEISRLIFVCLKTICLYHAPLYNRRIK